jgi:hypothetical protein
MGTTGMQVHNFKIEEYMNASFGALFEKHESRRRGIQHVVLSNFNSMKTNMATSFWWLDVTMLQLC